MLIHNKLHGLIFHAIILHYNLPRFLGVQLFFRCVGVSLVCVSVGDMGLCQMAICWYMRAVS